MNPNTEWKPAYLYEVTTGNIRYDKYENKAHDYYIDEESGVEKLLVEKWKFKFEKFGETLSRPVPKEKKEKAETSMVKRKTKN